MSRQRWKGAAWLGMVAAAPLLWAGGRGGWALGAGLGAFLWLALETRRRQQAHFGGGGLAERHARLAWPALGVQAVPGCELLLLHHAGHRVSLFDLASFQLRWERGFSEAPLAAMALPDGRLLWAGESSLHLSDAQGRDQARLGFQAPLLRQAYRLSLSQDGRRVLLSTPWLALVAQADLSGWEGSVRWEDAGHYLKQACLAPDGGGLLLGGALLLEEADSGGGAMQGRWDLWRPGEGGGWVKAWGQAAESYANTHLRALRWAGPDLLLLELQSQGYEFRLLGADGSERWRRRGEHPVLSPGQGLLAFETDSGLHVGGLDGAERWRWAHQERLRAVRLHDDASVTLLEGMHLRGFDAQGRSRWSHRWKRDPQHVALLAEGALALEGERLSLLRLPGAGA
jgi:hypothetical protein